MKSAKGLRGFRLGARDGEIGHVKDFYFDDPSWVVRYLVADTGNWLPKRQVLISPHAVTGFHTEPHEAIEVSLSREQIEQSPSIDTHRPVSRQFETRYFEYFGWPSYWPGPLLWGPVAFPGAPLPSSIPAVVERDSQSEDSHLHSFNELTSYSLQCLDEHFGHAEDCLIEEQTWAIRYLVVDTRSWLPGKKVLISPEWISSVSWPEMRVYVDFDRETLKRAPEYDPDQPLTRELERRLYEHFSLEPYWEHPPRIAA
jgi:hypothetical protein